MRCLGEIIAGKIKFKQDFEWWTGFDQVQGRKETLRQESSKVGPGKININKLAPLGFKFWGWTWPAWQLHPTEPQLPPCKCSSGPSREASVRLCVPHLRGSSGFSVLWVSRCMSEWKPVIHDHSKISPSTQCYRWSPLSSLRICFPNSWLTSHGWLLSDWQGHILESNHAGCQDDQRQEDMGCLEARNTTGRWSYRLGILVSEVCRNKLPQTRQLKTTKIYCPTVLESRSPKWMCPKCWFLL